MRISLIIFVWHILTWRSGDVFPFPVIYINLATFSIFSLCHGMFKLQSPILIIIIFFFEKIVKIPYFSNACKFWCRTVSFCLFWIRILGYFYYQFMWQCFNWMSIYFGFSLFWTSSCDHLISWSFKGLFVWVYFIMIQLFKVSSLSTT